jgi:formylglycine-generating enzyme required for sulfatase activity
MDDAKLLGDYKLIKQIGQGTLGTLFVAEHRFTKKHFALKVLPEELCADRGFLQRFEEEVAIISSLDHPHIVKTHNVSFSKGLYFLVADCIVDQMGESTNLWNYFSAKNKNLSEDELVHIAMQLASALDYAHGLKNANSRKLVHRGIKFNNILIGFDPNKSGLSSLCVYLSDFGLSKVIGTGMSLIRNFKAFGESLGPTPAYQKTQKDPLKDPLFDRYQSVETQKLSSLHQSMLQCLAFLAPEQKRIELVSDEKVDVYAFGVLIYYLLMGDYPEGFFPLPTQLKADMKWNWDLVVTECLKPDPKERPSSLEELLFRAAPKEETHQVEHHDLIQEKRAFDPYTGAHASVRSSGAPEFAKQEAPVATMDPQFDLFAIRSKTTQEEFRAALLPREKIIKEYQPEKKEIRHIQPLLSEMVVIPGNVYFRGSNNGCRDEMPRHPITLSSFAMDVHPVTNEQFVRYIEALGQEKDSQNHDLIRLKESRIKKSSGKCIIEPGYAKHPVVGVTWYGAVGYATWIGKRLPTEAEWEIACRGGLENPMYPTGDSIEKTQANFFSSDTTAVMSYPQNNYGLYDMAGNVYEWCSDWYEYNYYEVSAHEPDYPKGPLQGVYRVLRGGCWKSLQEDLRCSKRHRNNPGASNGTYGFRCAKDVS